MHPFKIVILLAFFSSTLNAQTSEPAPSLYDIAINDINGEPINLAAYRGKKILFVNVASKCGFTKQYKGLQELYEFNDDKLMVIGVPCNQFGDQEPGTASEIQSFCTANYGVTFLITEKVDVKGADQHPLYQWLTQQALNGKADSEIKWNFQKYLIDEDGNFVDFFYSAVEPLDTKLTGLL